MENKKGAFPAAVGSNNEVSQNEASQKHHQHNTAPQHLRLLQYGLKYPNHQHPQPPQPHVHQQINSSLHLHLHQHNQQVQYKTHRHLQQSPQFNNINIQANPAALHNNQKYVHQHIQQKPNNQYQTQPPPPSIHPHNPISQNTPQIWVPHQPPVHYHQQQQQQKEAQKQSTPTTTPQPVNKAKEVVERKKSSGSTSQLRSPAAKRPLEAPVTLQGWLYKQGSEGLMLWKKRWFVLSEYCLFYYKGMEEEKLLGSILLPSYKVSICGPEDKVNRKFAFKCEHANMRTYVLAAETQKLMLQWIRVLNAACLLQSNLESDQQASVDAEVQSTENVGRNSHNIRSTPVHMHSSSNTTDLSNPSQQELSQCNQPLYANAPPKPRRLNEGYSSPSPDILERYPNPQYAPTLHGARSVAKSPLSIYGPLGNPEFQRPKNPHEYIYTPTRELHMAQNAERRTPDTYGRSKLNTKTRHPTDYEDVYGDQYMYKRPLSPIAYNHVIKKTNTPVNPAYRVYTPVNMLGPRDLTQLTQLRKSPSTIARPHSADFLEYEINHRQVAAAPKQQPRPKSSLDINRTSDNDYFYSEERYAEKMRKSAQYLHKNPVRYQPQNEYLIHPKPIPAYAEPPATLTRSNTQGFGGFEAPQPVRSRSVLSEGSLSKELDMDLRASPREVIERDTKQDIYAYNLRNQYDQFTRSASARLAHNGSQNSGYQEERPVNRDGDRKREESMKRLLEWKQRMLQSPLNRKAQNRAYSSRADFYHANQDNGYMSQKFDVNVDGRRSVNNLPQYNSYSSDDEENEERSKESVHSQAGRTLDTFPNNSESLTPAQTTSTTVFSPLEEPNKPKIDFLHNTISPAKEADSGTFTKPLKQFNKDSSNIAHVSSLKSEYSDKFEQSPIVTEIKSNGALVKSILAEFDRKSENSENEAVVLRKNLITPTEDVEAMVEENYMTMTPKMNILGPRSSTNSDATVIFNETEENPYVEMTQNLDGSLLATEQNEQQPYEMVCFSEGRLEPVYMELKQPKKNLIKKPMQELPDVLISPQNKSGPTPKSDSSDADDEASKDLDSLDIPSQPRFSLSDTFRPASYYLGASQTVPEFQDSSDSELVSPPPIPVSPPPMDDLEDCVSSTQELSLIEHSKKDETYGFSLHVHRNSDQFFNSANREQFYSKSKFKKGSTQSLDTKKNFIAGSLKDPDTSSMGSSNTETERFGSRMSHNSDSDIELRLPRAADYERMLKRRPVSEEFCDELESTDGTINETVDSVDLDKYLKDLQISNLSLVSIEESNDAIFNTTRCHEYENLFISNFSKKMKVSTPDTISNLSFGSDTVRTGLMNSLPGTSNDKHGGEDLVQRRRPVSSASTSAEITGLLSNSNCSTPSIRMNSSISASEVQNYSMNETFGSNSFTQPPAPYYYSDLSVNNLNNDCSSILTLNNQRGAMNGSKRDITHIINPIKCNTGHLGAGSSGVSEENTFKLAAEARSVSVDFLNLTDKPGHIDKKNIYESDTLKRQKEQVDREARNVYPASKNDKFTEVLGNLTNVRRSHSLEGLLENVLSEDRDVSNEEERRDDGTNQVSTEGSYLWEEDAIWRERLRSVSQRHTKSMEDLDCIEVGETKKQKKSPRGIIRGATYVNDHYYNMPMQDKQQKDMENKLTVESGKNENKKEGNFILDREKLRQWDLLSSAPSDDQLTSSASKAPRENDAVVEIGEGSCEPTDSSKTHQAASGSISLNTRDTFPRTLNKRCWNPGTQGVDSRSVTNLNRTNEADPFLTQSGYFANQSSSQDELNQTYVTRKDNWQMSDKMNVSAGELLGRTHEELVLLLIQLRRQSSQTLQAIENCYNEIDTIQAQLQIMDQQKRLENLQKLEQIKQHLLELEKQYEKGKPLVNLVDNMVKLGSLYRVPSDRNNLTPYLRDRLEFNQQIQERRLLAEEKRDWNRLHPNHLQLQEKVQQLYQLDRLIHEESGTLQNLQQDKEDIERALGGLRMRLNKGFNDPAEIEQARKQQIMLENELSRVHLMLAQNSKKLEETVAGNARLEQELLVLKQKLQITRQHRSSPQFSNAGDSLPCAVGTSAMLESDLLKVQKKIGDLQKQRHELSMQVRLLTDRSSNLPQLKSNGNSGYKKKLTSLWRETDLDTMNIVDHGEAWEGSNSTTPLYINTDMKQQEDYYRSKSSDSTSDDTAQNMPVEKQEIKTVRIVKRESERRQRDREKSYGGKWDALMEEDDSSQNSSILFRPAPIQKTQSSILVSPTYEPEDKTAGILSRQSSISSPSLQNYSDVRGNSSTDLSNERSPELSPIFKSEAARQIITEMTIQETPKQVNRRVIPKEKRRHYTAPHNNLIMKSLNQLPTDDNAFDKMILNTRRARDDLDMERALRQRIDTPDVVRSTLSNKELKYNESTIDSILGTPSKINIPERYIPEQLPQLSAEEQEHRLRKVESIKKMLSDTTIISGSSSNVASDEKVENSSNIMNKATTKMIEEKKQREHLLQLNQILAKQVMEMSKIVAGSNNPDEK